MPPARRSRCTHARRHRAPAGRAGRDQEIPWNWVCSSISTLLSRVLRAYQGAAVAVKVVTLANLPVTLAPSVLVASHDANVGVEVPRDVLRFQDFPAQSERARAGSRVHPRRSSGGGGQLAG